MVTSESALLIIDMQQGLFNGPEAPFAANSILSNISLLITKARASAVRLCSLKGESSGPIWRAKKRGTAEARALVMRSEMVDKIEFGIAGQPAE